MRVVGMFLLGLGITLLIPGGIAVGCAESPGQVVGFLVCTGLIPVPMIVAGIAIIRRLERSPARHTDAPEPAAAVTGDPVSRTLQRARRFDLNRLNWVGWLVFLATFGFVIAEAVVIGMALRGGFWGERLARQCLG